MSKSRAVMSLIDEDVNVSRSTTLGGYEKRSEEEGTSSKSPASFRKSERKEKGVEKRLEKLKEVLLVELKN